MSNLLTGLKQYPVDITAVVSVCDDGSSTGILREEFNIPAVGDIRRVLISLSETSPFLMELFNYRFSTTSDLDGHTIGNLLLTASEKITGNLSSGIDSLSKVLNLKGKVLPLTDDNAILIGELIDGRIIEGEHNITNAKSTIKKVYYKNEVKVNKNVITAIREADLIIFSMGSLYTSVIPNLLIREIVEEIDKCSAKVMYISNLVTQIGETSCFTVSDHVRVLNNYLGKRKLDVVIANNEEIDNKILDFYSSTEKKEAVILDKDILNDIEVIEDKLFNVTESNLIRHDNIKLGLLICNYLMKR